MAEETNSDNSNENTDTKTNKVSFSVKKERIWQVATVVLAIILIAVTFSGGTNITGYAVSGDAGEEVILAQDTGTELLQDKDAAANAFISHLNDNVLQGATAELNSIEVENGMYHLTFAIGGRPYDVYSQDGRKWLQEAVDLDEEPQQPAAQQQAPPPQEIEKSSKPTVELFIMSYCPFGTQAQKGMLPVAELLGDKIEYSVKWVDYIMHDKKEIDENLNQYCIQEVAGDKYLDYLTCFLDSDDHEKCVNTAGIDRAALDTCIEDADAEFKITELYNDKSTWSGGRYPQFNVHSDLNAKYGVGGSPSLVINGQSIQSNRDPASYLRTVCSAFTTAPGECSEQLSSASPSTGFGLGGTGSGSGGECN